MIHNPEYIESRTFIPTLVELRGELSQGGIKEKIDTLSTKLSEYVQGNPEHPKSGFESFRKISEGDFDQGQRIPEQVKQEQVGVFRHRSESYKEDLVYLDRDIREGYVVEFELVDVFWMDPIMIFQGDRGAVNSVIRGLQREVMDEIKINQIDINPELFYTNNINIESNLQSGDLITVSAEGISTEIEQARITGNVAATDFAERGQVTHIFKRFEYLGLEILAHITRDSVTVQSINTDVDLSHEETVLISIGFVDELLNMNQTVSKSIN